MESEMNNEYNGCSDIDTIETISYDDLTSLEFFQQYIVPRKPVLFNNLLTDKEWKFSADHSYLKNKCSSEPIVKVEFRASLKDKFGLGNEKNMGFFQFLDKIENGSSDMYLTTQELEYDEDEQPYIMTTPLSYMKDDFPLCPKLFGNLIPFNINFWYGQSPEYSTTGLHHDFHDNLYIMLKGEKEFTLCSPAYAHLFYLNGPVTKIHKNGRFNYLGQPTHADGRDIKAEKALEASRALEIVMSNENDDDEVEKALEAVLDAEMDGQDNFFDEDDSGDGSDGEIFDDDEEEDEEEEYDDSADDDKLNENQHIIGKKRQISSINSVNNSEILKPKKLEKKIPNSFSLVDTSLSDEELKKKFPLFLEAKKHCIKITIKAGQMLFIPCGWFHEVKSKGSTGHVAFNYWFHPPDNDNFNKPYQSDFWLELYKQRKIEPGKIVK